MTKHAWPVWCDTHPRGVCRQHVLSANAEMLYRDLQAISRESTERQTGLALLADADLYDEDGLPA